ncbi:haloacid dehalogenase type II [Spirosoma taeanense]|uniref:Haloacid dehalogenase type II n=1 Tax=Spirosoma taeanense TaxID=2735870 RepID=A0A6M5YAH0_9BACT|nr:haloacid dehalogenase type II [Spirosoma taeanense]QJW90366.1 haloacid dehalogenase type II [Spirosoma taeanense]
MPVFSRPRALVFDVNETLLDMSPVKQAFLETFDTEFAFTYWFSLMLQYSLVDTVSGSYHTFPQIGEAVLKMTTEFFNRPLSEEVQKQLLHTMAHLPPHPDVEDGLQQLRQAGFRLAALTNSPGDSLSQHMQQTGLGHYFEGLWTVDDVQVFKPSPKTYQLALSRLGLGPQETMMVAAHGWDIAGAARVGMQTAFIARNGQSVYPLATPATLTGDTVGAIARQLIAH